MSHRLVLGACWSRKFWELSAVSKEEWTKGTVCARKEGRPVRQREKEASVPERRKINAESKNGWMKTNHAWKAVRKWTSGVHLELGFLSHNVRVFTHFVV
jgi:hypothetical protein